MSCERSIEVSKELIAIDNDYFLKEITYSDGSGSTRYIYIVVDKDGVPVQGASASYLQGKITSHTASIIIPDDTEYKYYKKLKEKYERAEK
jgi:hypothetical protein